MGSNWIRRETHSNTKKLFILPRRTQTASSQPQTNAVEPSQELVTQITQARGDSEPLKQKQKEPRKAKTSRPAPFQFQFDPSAFGG